MNITILTSYDRISLFHTLKPFLFHRGSFRFTFTDSVEKCMNKDRNTNLLVMRLPHVENQIEVFQALRRKYDRLVLLNDGAAAGINNFELLPLVDRFIVKSMLRDRTQYSKPLYRSRLFTDYYHRTTGVTDPDMKEKHGNALGDGLLYTEEDLNKLRLGWNIGVGDFPRQDLRQRAGVFIARVFTPKLSRFNFRRSLPKFSEPGGSSNAGKRDISVHARLGSIPKPSVNKQRELFLSLVDGDSRFVTGSIPKKQYDEQMRRSLMTLSPFGWGEVCFRDFEALFAGTLLLKPNMAHLNTWPDIYKPGETYVPLSWNGEDLLKTVEYYQSHSRERSDIVKNAQEMFKSQIEQLPQRFCNILEEAFKD
ncbi:MAG: glycosyltransferase [Desulfatiglandaceae bacterium]